MLRAVPMVSLRHSARPVGVQTKIGSAFDYKAGLFWVVIDRCGYMSCCSFRGSDLTQLRTGQSFDVEERTSGRGEIVVGRLILVLPQKVIASVRVRRVTLPHPLQNSRHVRSPVNPLSSKVSPFFCNPVIPHHPPFFSQSYGGEQVLLSSARHLEYSQRWGVLAHKLDKCAEALSLLKFPVALYFAQSARHDLQGLQALLQQGAGELTTVLDCYEVSRPGFGLVFSFRNSIFNGPDCYIVLKWALTLLSEMQSKRAYSFGSYSLNRCVGGSLSWVCVTRKVLTSPVLSF